MFYEAGFYTKSGSPDILLVECVCGRQVTKKNYVKHIKTNLHKKFELAHPDLKKYKEDLDLERLQNKGSFYGLYDRDPVELALKVKLYEDEISEHYNNMF